MRLTCTLAVAALAVAGLGGCSTHADNSPPAKQVAATQPVVPTKAAPASRPGWELVFDDEFDGDALDLAKWNPRDPVGRERNHELQAYVPDAFRLSGGVLHVVAERRQADYGGKTRGFTSGMMTTTGKFAQRYGRFEIRCRIPAGKGLWPAFWLLPEPFNWPPEIDVLETLGHEPNVVHLSQHWRNPHAQPPAGHHLVDRAGPVQGFSRLCRRVVARADRLVRRRHAALPVGAGHPDRADVPAGQPGRRRRLARTPDDKTPFPSSLDVDYVRVYKAQ